MIVIGAGFVLLPGAPLLATIFYSQVLNGVLLPVVLVLMLILILINNPRIMGKYVNGISHNGPSRSCARINVAFLAATARRSRRSGGTSTFIFASGAYVMRASRRGERPKKASLDRGGSPSSGRAGRAPSFGLPDARHPASEPSLISAFLLFGVHRDGVATEIVPLTVYVTLCLGQTSRAPWFSEGRSFALIRIGSLTSKRSSTTFSPLNPSSGDLQSHYTRETFSSFAAKRFVFSYFPAERTGISRPTISLSGTNFSLCLSVRAMTLRRQQTKPSK
jgi:hypothetical protein